MPGLDRALASAIADWARLKPEISEVWIFGSRARGTESLDSDLDLAIIMANANASADSRLVTWMFNKTAWETQLQEIIPIKVHLELGDVDLTDLVSSAVQQDGICLYRAGDQQS